MLGVIWVGYDARQKELRAEVIRRCNDVKPQMNCFGEATGKVAAGMSADIVLMRDAIIKFKFNR